MRLSADKDDPGYGPAYLTAKVLLDGVELKDCITADEERGECLCFLPTATGTQLDTEMRCGKVEIILPS